tara:strand:+ start:295 stop:1248 length:954 start_codon:yes stop_codon:yes gene_type:complete
MSYIIDTNTDSSKIIHLNTADATTYLDNNLTTYCQFNLDTPIIIDKQHSALISLNSAIIPYSMYNIREQINDTIPYRVVSNPNEYFYFVIPKGNYTITTLATQVVALLDGLEHTSSSYSITFDRKTMKYTFTTQTQEIFFDFSLRTDTAHIELGFKTNEISPITGIGSGVNSLQSSNVCDVNGSIHSLFIRTNLTSKSSIDSQTKSFSTILGKIPIDNNFGSILFFNPRDNTQKILLDTHIINIITIRITDELNRNVDLNGLHCNMSILIDIVNKKDFLKVENRRTKEEFIQKKIDNQNQIIEKRGRPRKVGRPKGT